MGDFETALQASIFTQKAEKTYIDKILAKQEAERFKELVRKPKLQREDLLELLYLLSGVESKLVNYGEWDRYVILKFFVWVREFVKCAEILYDYQDDLFRMESVCKDCKGTWREITKPETIKITCKCTTPNKTIILSENAKKLLYNSERNIEHSCKFLIDLYLNMARTTLSLGASGFKDLTSNRFEMDYKNQPGLNTPIQEQKTGFFGLGGKK
jgi:hypothetical protein